MVDIKEIRGLSAWMKVISTLNLPSLNTVVSALCELTNDVDSSAEQFTQLVLRDADLTSQVLKVANSVQYNRSLKPIKTVSRAIIQIGHLDLKNIALASTLIDGFLKAGPRKRLIESLARSFHSAVQARAIAQYHQQQDHEEVFIAALLLNIAELALLSTGREQVERFIRARNKDPDNENAIAREHLGVGLRPLGKALSQHWGLGGLVQKAIEGDQSDPLVKAVMFGDQITRALPMGANNKALRDIIRQISDQYDKPESEVSDQILLMADEAASVASTYGAQSIIEALPKPDEFAEPSCSTESSSSSNPQEMHRYLNRITKAIMNEEPLPMLLRLAIQGLKKGAGFERVVLWLYVARESRLEPLSAVGKVPENWRDYFHIKLKELNSNDSLSVSINAPTVHRFDEKTPPVGALKRLMGPEDGMFVPLQSPDRLVGFIYADKPTERLTDQQAEEIQLIANQVNLYLKMTLPHSK